MQLSSLVVLVHWGELNARLRQLRSKAHNVDVVETPNTESVNSERLGPATERSQWKYIRRPFPPYRFRPEPELVLVHHHPTLVRSLTRARSYT